MGLAICRSIVEAHDDVCGPRKLSDRQRRLSIHRPSTGMKVKTESTMRASQAVFIVDDDASICEGLSNLLESVGVRALAYSSAESILESWSESNAGCMLLDARLPGMSGVEFQEKMQQLGIGMPVIFMTAHGDIPMVRKVMKAGAVEFLTKPFQKEELLHAIDHAFAFDREQTAGRRDS